MSFFLSISYKEVLLIRVLLFTYFTLYFVYVVCTVHGTHNGYIHMLLYSVLFYYTVHVSGIKFKKVIQNKLLERNYVLSYVLKVCRPYSSQ